MLTGSEERLHPRTFGVEQREVGPGGFDCDRVRLVLVKHLEFCSNIAELDR